MSRMHWTTARQGRVHLRTDPARRMPLPNPRCINLFTPDPLTRLQRAVAEIVDALCDYIGVPRLDNAELTEDDMP